MSDVSRLTTVISTLKAREEDWWEKKSPVQGLSTGLPSLDFLTGGLVGGRVWVIGARTNEGKTALALQIGFGVAEELAFRLEETGERVGKVLIFSPEMMPEDLLLRQACQRAEVSSTKIRSGSATPQQRETWQMALDTFGMLDDVLVIRGGSLDMADVTGMVDHMVTVENDPPSLVIVDYVQRMTADRKPFTDYQAASAISTRLKDIANDHDIPVLALSQVNREPEKETKDGQRRQLRLSDLQGTGRLEQDADVVLLLDNPTAMERIGDGDSHPRTATLSIAKNRHGPTAAIPLIYRPHITRFVDKGPDKVEIDGGSL